MPLLFSYGTLQQDSVQLAAFGRRLAGKRDALPGFEPSVVPIDDPQLAAASGRTHHANVTRNGNDTSRVPGLAFEVSDAELLRADRYEAEFQYGRVAVLLASGREAWVYLHAPTSAHVSPLAPEPVMGQVVFVCEHGSAKSVLAASYFNHLAERTGLSLRAVARGTAPDADLPAPVVDGLRRNGLLPCTIAPTALTPDDLGRARQVVTFDQPQVSALVADPARVLWWNGLPPVSADFEIAREAIFTRVRELLADLAREPGNPEDAV